MYHVSLADRLNDSPLLRSLSSDKYDENSKKEEKRENSHGTGSYRNVNDLFLLDLNKFSSSFSTSFSTLFPTQYGMSNSSNSAPSSIYNSTSSVPPSYPNYIPVTSPSLPTLPSLPLVPSLPSIWIQFLSAISKYLFKSGEILRTLFLKMKEVGLINKNIREIKNLLSGLKTEGTEAEGRGCSDWIGAADSIVAEVCR